MSDTLYEGPQVVYVIRVFGGYLQRESAKNPNNRHGLQRNPCKHPALAKWFNTPEEAAEAAAAVQGMEIGLCVVDSLTMTLKREGHAEAFL